MSEELAKKIFAKNLQYFLSLNGKKQVDLAKYLQCSTGLVSAWCGAKKMPRVETIQSICDWLHIDLSDLLDDKTELQEEGYYINEETKKIAQEIYGNHDLYCLFKICSDMPTDKIRALMDFVKKWNLSEK